MHRPLPHGSSALLVARSALTNAAFALAPPPPKTERHKGAFASGSGSSAPPRKRAGAAAAASAPAGRGSSRGQQAAQPAAGQHKGKSGGRGKAPISSLFTGNEDGEELGAPAAKKKEHSSHPRRTRNPAVFAGTHFRDLGLVDRLVRQLEEKISVTKLTPAQQLAAPFLMMNRDVMLKSPTGTGKTLAYAVPIVQDLQGLKHRVSGGVVGAGERTVCLVNRQRAPQT